MGCDEVLQDLPPGEAHLVEGGGDPLRHGVGPHLQELRQVVASVGAGAGGQQVVAEEAGKLGNMLSAGFC